MPREVSPPFRVRHRFGSDLIAKIETMVARRIAEIGKKARNAPLLPAEGNAKECKCANLRPPYILPAI